MNEWMNEWMNVIFIKNVCITVISPSSYYLPIIHMSQFLEILWSSGWVS
jgi:hypothetical protein